MPLTQFAKASDNGGTLEIQLTTQSIFAVKGLKTISHRLKGKAVLEKTERCLGKISEQ